MRVVNICQFGAGRIGAIHAENISNQGGGASTAAAAESGGEAQVPTFRVLGYYCAEPQLQTPTLWCKVCRQRVPQKARNRPG